MDSLATALNPPPEAMKDPPQAIAQVWLGDDRLEQRHLPLPTLAGGEVLVKITLATVCGSDRHTVHGHRPSPAPGILGHEAVGEIAGLGSAGATSIDGEPLSLGDRVVWSVAVSCGSCDRCGAGRTAKCRTVRKIGHEPLSNAWQLSGGYATHIVLPVGAHIARVPDAVPDPPAAPAACATATVMAAAESAGSLEGRTVMIIGAGMLGLSAVALARAKGAADIVVVDPDPSRRDLASTFGADQVAERLDVDLDPSTGSGSGSGFDVVLDFSGAPRMIEAAAARLTIGGRMVLVGSVTPSDPVRLDPEQIVRRWLTVTGVHNYEPRHLLQALELLARTANLLPWNDLVSPPRPLAELGEVFHPLTGNVGTNSGTSYPRVAVRP